MKTQTTQKAFENLAKAGNEFGGTITDVLKLQQVLNKTSNYLHHHPRIYKSISWFPVIPWQFTLAAVVIIPNLFALSYVLFGPWWMS